MKLLNFPERIQIYEYDCGANAIQSVLNYYGINIKEGIIMKMADTKKTGTSISGIKKVAHKYNLKTKAETMTITKIKKYIDKEIPVIVALQARTDKKNVDRKNNRSNGHYAIVIGYDKDKLYFEDPFSIFRTFLSLKEFEDRRHDKDTKGKKYYNYGIAIYGKKPGYSLKKIIHMD